MKTNRKLFLMMGIPGSGKSSWAIREIQYANEIFNDVVYISRDNIRYNLLQDEDKYFDKEKEVFKIFCDKINQAIANPQAHAIVADATHLNSKSRYKLLNQLENKNYLDEINVIFMATPIDIAIERNNQRTGRAKVPAQTIRQMHKTIELPTEKEGINRLYIVNTEGKVVIKDLHYKK